MTKKDYQLIAEVIHDTYQSYLYDETEYTWDEVMGRLIERMASALETDNDRFNKVKFIAAATPV